MARGGPRTPARPAAVSGPGAHSQRTDGGPSSGTAQMAAPGGSYGDRKAIEEQAAAAPVSTGGAPGGGGAPAPTGGGAAPSPFAPTQRPGEPITTGVPTPPGMAPDVEMTLRALYNRFPSPHIGRLLTMQK